MNEDIYKTPESELDVTTDHLEQEFYVVSITKFTVLYFATLGTYSVYWFYKNWKMQNIYHDLKVWPVPRAIFNIFFTHSLFSAVTTSLRDKEKNYTWSAQSLATLYVVLAIASNVVDRMSAKEFGSPYTDTLSILILPFVYFPLLKAQKAINICQDDPQGDSNSEFTALNIVWILIGILLWSMVGLGLLIELNVVNP